MKTNLLLALLLVGMSAQALDKFAIDPAHASAVFKINHMGFSNVYGMFGDISGEFSIDDKKPDQSKMNVTIKTASLDTKNAKRDEHLKKPDFFDTKQYPEITFKSSSIKKIDDKNYDVKGELTMHGVTKPLSFKLVRFRTGEDPMKKIKTGGEAKFTVKRSDFGMNFMVGPEKVGDDVEIMMSVEAAKI